MVTTPLSFDSLHINSYQLCHYLASIILTIYCNILSPKFQGSLGFMLIIRLLKAVSVELTGKTSREGRANPQWAFVLFSGGGREHQSSPAKQTGG